MNTSLFARQAPQIIFRLVRELIGTCAGQGFYLFPRGLPIICVSALLPIVLAGCASSDAQQPGTLTREEGQAIFNAPGKTARDLGKWTIVLAAFRGEEALQAAQFAQARVASEAGLTTTRLEERGQSILLTIGRFDGPQDPAAAAELRRVRNVEMRGVKPFEQALLTPPEPTTGTNPQYDLRNVAQNFGPGFEYTLQIGSYGRDDGRAPTDADRTDARSAAEQAVAVLRSEGEQAFYFHGPNFSSVTVGLFRADEVDPQTGLRSPAFYDLQAKFPLNLFNGAQRMVRLEGSQRAQPQRSVLVRIPR